MKKLNLGLIGLSEGNGHPYSWSAIINGYDPKLMERCPFPVIIDYLKRQKTLAPTIKHAKVTHIWTQDLMLSQSIANTTFIDYVVKDYQEMIGQVDGILLARDDAENHLQMAKPFLEAGIPIYIDKPLAYNKLDAKKIFNMQQYDGQIFTCSAFQYARELDNLLKLSINPEDIYFIEGWIKNSWNKYAIHLIEPILRVIGLQNNIEKVSAITTTLLKKVFFTFSNKQKVSLTNFKSMDIKPTLHFFHPCGVESVVFEDTYYAFKAAIEQFLMGIFEKRVISKKHFVLYSIDMIERGNHIH